MFFFLLSLLLSLSEPIFGMEYRIHNASEFIQFTNKVNSGTNYVGVTILLDSDIEFAGETLEPIGKNDHYYFLGAFDGQGHTISGLQTYSHSEYVGLFGYSGRSITIKNVVLDSSCSIEGTLGTPSRFMGGILGYFYEKDEAASCDIENCVNMASITFKGTVKNTLSMGGIVGGLYSQLNLKSNIRNCANYGTIAYDSNGIGVYTGGIAGILQSTESSIQNCINYGTIVYKDPEYMAYIGGIAGSIRYSAIENSVNVGTFYTKEVKSNRIGGIVGTSSLAAISHCYWSEDTHADFIGISGMYPSTVVDVAQFDSNFVLNESISIGEYRGKSLIEALNAYSDFYAHRDYSRWALNRNEINVTFKVDGLKDFTQVMKVILLPGLANEGARYFDGWYTDSEFTAKFLSNEITESMELFGRVKENPNTYTISFNTRGEDPIEPITAPFGSVVDLPRGPVRDGCSIAFWENEYGEKVAWKFIVPSRNVTLSVVWGCARIKTAEELVDFSKAVKSNSTIFKGTTVALESDIAFTDELSKKFEPIGYSYGVFDGQGHTISNLEIKTQSMYYVGLFGSVNGLTVKNVVVDDSCSFSTSYSESMNIFMGGLIGYCYTSNRYPCSIENSINKASVSFSGVIRSRVEACIGGVAGRISLYNSRSSIKNCANYGSVTHNGESTFSYLGGVIGDFEGHVKNKGFIQNCVNYGTITHSEINPNNRYIGGISGGAYKIDLDNCVNYGRLTSLSSPVLSITGATDLYTSITHCYWADNHVGGFYNYSHEIPTTSENSNFNENFILNKSVSVGNYKGTLLIEALNAAADYYTLRGYSRWALNKNGKDVTFKVGGSKDSKTNSKIVLLPSFAGRGNVLFDGWYVDSEFTTKFTRKEITENTDLYGEWVENNETYTISFDTRGGAPMEPVTGPYGSSVVLANSTGKDRCTFAFWETSYGDRVERNFIVPAHDVTLYAVWGCTLIKTADDLISFSKVVNEGVLDYTWTVVYLNYEIDLKGKTIEPIGKNPTNFFRGTFDGRWYTIRNLVMNLSSQYVGLFGYSEGMTVKNLRIENTCSFASNIDSEDAYVGSLIGRCLTKTDLCRVINCTNMASVTATGPVKDEMRLGGLAGFIGTDNYQAFVTGNTNYGHVTRSGEGYHSYIGGIIGESHGYTHPVHVDKSDNYGNVIFDGPTDFIDLRIDGIVGLRLNTKITNCTNYGKVSAASSISILSFAWVLLIMLIIH